MKSLALSLLVVALSAILISAQAPGRKQGGSESAAPAAVVADPEKPFVAPCGLKQKLETNCNGKSDADKVVTCLNKIIK
jgi:hypothetical protein